MLISVAEFNPPPDMSIPGRKPLGGKRVNTLAGVRSKISSANVPSPSEDGFARRYKNARGILEHVYIRKGRRAMSSGQEDREGDVLIR